MKKNLTICVLFVTVLLSVPIVFAQETRFDENENTSAEETSNPVSNLVDEVSDEVQDVKDTVSKVTCIRGFSNFLGSIIDLEDFSVYWNDLFTKNMCYLSDVIDIEDEMDSIQEELRQSYYSCDYTNVADLEKEYKMKKIELYFVRNVIGIDTESLTSYEIQNYKDALSGSIKAGRFATGADAESPFNFKPLYDDMYAKYVEGKGWISKDDFPAYFDGLTNEYSDNMISYLDCDYADWQVVADKWQELMDVFKSLKKSAESEEQTAEETVGTDEGENPGAKDGVWAKTKDYFAKHLDAKLAVVDNVPDNLSNLWAQEGSVDQSYVDSTSILGLYDTYLTVLDEYDSATLEAELMAKYETLYGDGSADITDAFVRKLNLFGEILGKSYTNYMPDIKSYTKDIAKKQCTN